MLLLNIIFRVKIPVLHRRHMTISADDTDTQPWNGNNNIIKADFIIVGNLV